MWDRDDLDYGDADTSGADEELREIARTTVAGLILWAIAAVASLIVWGCA